MESNFNLPLYIIENKNDINNLVTNNGYEIIKNAVLNINLEIDLNFYYKKEFKNTLNDLQEYK